MLSPKIGIDIVSVRRLDFLIIKYGERFTRQVFTRSELLLCNGRPAKLAGRFAAKEAIAKVMGCGLAHMSIYGVPTREIEVIADALGRPEIILYGRAKEYADRIGLSNFQVSLSHTIDHAIAVAVAV